MECLRGAFVAALMALALTALAAEPPPISLADIPQMHEEAAAAGLARTYDGPGDRFGDGGAAALDCDGSGFPSLFIAGGKNPAKLFVNTSSAGGPLKFEERPFDLGDPKWLEHVIGAYPLDIDGDGRMDLFVLRDGTNLLLKGGPDCTFTPANEDWGFAGEPVLTTGFSATWEKGQKFPTLAIGRPIEPAAPGSQQSRCEGTDIFRPGPGDRPDYSRRATRAPGPCAAAMTHSNGGHSELADFNNDSLPDLFAPSGDAASIADFSAFAPDTLLLAQWSGQFAPSGQRAGLPLNLRALGAAVIDLNLDGMLDVLTVNGDGPATLFRNLGADDGKGGARPMGNWSEIKLMEPNPNRNAIGARLSVKTGALTQTRTLEVGGGDVSGHAGWVHVGLGVAERAEIRVQWPDGEWSAPYKVFANQFAVLDRGKTQAEYWYPGR